MASYYLGIDTSNYTTSVSLVDESGVALFDKRILLRVKPGELGLRQSDAFYQHVMNLPGLFCDVAQSYLPDVKAVTVSSRPRNVEGSYMPVFNAGIQFASVIAKALNRPLYKVSHQDGHILADLSPCGTLKKKKLLNLHISGGTTEIFLANWRSSDSGFVPTLIGGTKDLSIGQLVDRIGVFFECPFPAGATMEKRIFESSAILEGTLPRLPLKEDHGYFNLSGLENKIKQLSREGVPAEMLMLALFTQIGDFLYQILWKSIQNYQPDMVVLAGGVMSNHWVRQRLLALKEDFKNVEIQLTEATLCTDNAVGIAKMGLLKEQR